MEEQVWRTIRRYQMILPGTKALLAVSGGADSMALLYFFYRYRPCAFYAAHVNHKLRGAESERDEQFVKEMCKMWEVPLFLSNEDVGTLASRSRKSIELCAREVRYHFLETLADELNARIATAHTRSDNVETLLLNQIRGCSVRGLHGIPPVRDRIIRPLLEVGRQEIENYCERYAVPYVNDSTNKQLDYTRNKIRHILIPILKELNPSFEKSAERVIKAARTDEAYLRQCAEEHIVRCGTAVGELVRLHEAVRHRVLYLAASGFCAQMPEEVHVRQLDEMVRRGKGRVRLPGGIEVGIQNGRLDVCKQKETGKIQESLLFRPDCEQKFNGYTIKTQVMIKAVNQNCNFIHTFFNTNMCDYDIIKNNFHYRTRKKGDYMHPVGRNIGKSLKKLMQEYRIPAEIRDKVPVLADGNRVVWVYGIGVDESVKVRESTKKILQFEVPGG